MAPNIEILYEDNHIVAVNKPANLLTQPTKLVEDSLLVRLKAFIKKRDHKLGNVFLEPIHRLDKSVSGIVVFAKTSKALSRLMKAIRERRCKKVYLALVEGKLKQASGTLENYLVHGEFKAHLSQKEEKEAKHALLTYRVIKTYPHKSLLEVVLETGRYHQIRAQLSLLHHPIVGDHKYGSKEPFEAGKIALHHTRFTLPHPTKEEEITIESPFNLSFLV